MTEIGTLLQTLLALGFVLCLIGLCALAARRFMPLLAKGLPTRQRRLQVVEILPLDPRNRAVILRCDAREHLLVLGEGGVTVVPHDCPPLPTGVTTP